MAKTAVICEKCGHVWDDWDEANKCEKSHIDATNVRSGKWNDSVKITGVSSKIKHYPKRISVNMIDGTIVRYTIHEGDPFERTPDEAKEISDRVEAAKEAFIAEGGGYQCTECGEIYRDPEYRNGRTSCPKCGAEGWDKYQYTEKYEAYLEVLREIEA